MAIPDDEKVRTAAVELLGRKGGTCSHTEILDLLAKRFRLTEADLTARLPHAQRPSGESVWKQKVRRVKAYMLKRGTLAQPSVAGQWLLATAPPRRSPR